MNKSKALTLSIFFCFSLGITNIAKANAEPCGAVLCLSGIQALDGNLGECKPHVKKFFSFNAFDKKGLFNPSVAYAKRFQWLNKCKSDDPLIPVFKSWIMTQYGYLQSSPF